ncbi:MAG: site-specific integrase, partial [Chloroflexota bacterium]
VVRNVADVVDAPRPEKKAPKAMNREQANRFLEIVRGDRFYPIYLLAIATGARQGELLGLHWPDVDLAACTIAIKYTVQEIRGQGLIVKEPKTDTSRRQISVPPVVVAALLEHKRRQAGVREKGLAAGVWQEQGFVFTTGSGNPVSPRNLQRHFHLVLKRNDLPRLPFHALRHTSASPLLAENVHPKVVQEMLGHSRIDMTLDTYSHVIPGMHRGAADKMESILGGG